MADGNGYSVQRMTFSLADVVKIIAVVASAVAFFFQVNGRLDNLDTQIAGIRSEQGAVRAELSAVRAQTDGHNDPADRPRAKRARVVDE